MGGVTRAEREKKSTSNKIGTGEPVDQRKRPVLIHPETNQLAGD